MKWGRKGMEFACVISLSSTADIPAEDNKGTSSILEVFLIHRL
jgi:hypothetical protein